MNEAKVKALMYQLQSTFEECMISYRQYRTLIPATCSPERKTAKKLDVALHQINEEIKFVVQDKASNAQESNPITHDISLDALLIKQTLPRVKLKSFGGNPLDWKRFRLQLQVLVEDRIQDPKQRLALLLSSLEGDAYTCAQSFYAHEPRSEAYDATLVKLEERFGDRELIVQLVRQKLRSLPMVQCNYRPYVISQMF